MLWRSAALLFLLLEDARRKMKQKIIQEMAKKIGLRVVRFEVGANDLWRVSTIKAERGIDYPYAHTVNFSLKLQF